MPAEAPPDISPDIESAEANFDVQTDMSNPANVIEVAQLEQQYGERAEKIALTTSDPNFGNIIDPNQEPIQENGIAVFSILPEVRETLADRLPPGVWQNGALIAVIREVENNQPQHIGYIMGSGRTWWFASFEDAMTVDPDYVAGFAQAFVLEKLRYAN